VTTAALTGLRLSELAGLKAKNVDMLGRRISVVEQLLEVGGRLETAQPKTKASMRSVAIPPTLAAKLGDHPVLLEGPGSLVFVMASGSPLRGNNFRHRVWIPAVSRAGLDGLRFHDLRHTAVVLAIAQGAHAKSIQMRMGHASITTTLDRYGHLFSEIDAMIGDGLEGFFSEQPSSVAPAARLRDAASGAPD
jgi:integrase